MSVCHRCDNPACVNPDHLFLGTHTDNMRDMISKGRANKSAGAAHWSKTRPEKTLKGMAHPRAKLSENDVLAIRADPRSNYAIANELGVSRELIRKIRNNALWRHL